MPWGWMGKERERERERTEERKIKRKGVCVWDFISGVLWFVGAVATTQPRAAAISSRRLPKPLPVHTPYKAIKFTANHSFSPQPHGVLVAL